MRFGVKSAAGSAYLFNIQQLPCGEGKLFVECYAEDILSKYSDVLIISAFRGSFGPTPGSVLSRIWERFRLSFAGGLPAGSRTFSHCLHNVPVNSTTAFKALWVLEISDYRRGSEPISLGEIKQAFQVLQRHIPDIVGRDSTSISLPLLGTGYQRLDLKEAIYETLNTVQVWQHKAPRLRCVRLFAFDLKEVATLNRVVDEFFNRPTWEATSHLLEAASMELSERLDDFKNPEISSALTGLCQVAKTLSPSVTSIAIEGRKTAEACTKILFLKYCPGANDPIVLGNRLEMIEKPLKATRASILAYLRLLQACGNVAAHGPGFLMDMTDAAAVIVSAIRVAEFTELDDKPRETHA